MVGFRELSDRLAAWTGTMGAFSRALDREGTPYLSFSKVVSVEFCSNRYRPQASTGYAEELEHALNELEAELTPQMDSARYLLMFHQLDAAANQDRSGDALQIAMGIRAAAQDDPVRSTGDHFMIPCYRFLCHHYHCQHDWLEVATCAEAGTDLAQRLGQKQAMGVFQMWQAVVSRQRGARDKAAHLFRSATSRMGGLKCPPERDYYDAECTYHELGGEWHETLHVRTRQIEDFTVRGHTYDEFDARRAHLRLLVRLGQPLEPHLSAARAATTKFRRPECYLPELDQIASSGNRPLGGA